MSKQSTWTEIYLGDGTPEPSKVINECAVRIVSEGGQQVDCIEVSAYALQRLNHEAAGGSFVPILMTSLEIYALKAIDFVGILYTYVGPIYVKFNPNLPQGSARIGRQAPVI